MRVPRRIWLLVPVVALACSSGCEPAKSSKKGPAGPPPPKLAAAAAPKVFGLGSIELTLDEPVKTARCYASLISPGSGRWRVLQVTSCEDPNQEHFPSVFLRAEVSADTPAVLVGQKLAARAYVQVRRNGPVWHSLPDRPVELTITFADGTGMEGDLLGGRLASTETGQAVDVKGKFTGAFR